MLELNKIYCMDCVEGMKQIEDNIVDLVVTSPPYNVGIKYESWNDNMKTIDYFIFAEKWLSEVYRVLKKDGRIALNIPYEVNQKFSEGRIFKADNGKSKLKFASVSFCV